MKESQKLWHTPQNQGKPVYSGLEKKGGRKGNAVKKGRTEFRQANRRERGKDPYCWSIIQISGRKVRSQATYPQSWGGGVGREVGEIEVFELSEWEKRGVKSSLKRLDLFLGCIIFGVFWGGGGGGGGGGLVFGGGLGGWVGGVWFWGFGVF